MINSVRIINSWFLAAEGLTYTSMGGDSLAGRYLLFHLWPFTLAELENKSLDMDHFLPNPLHAIYSVDARFCWERLSIMSGFPEPYLSNNPRSYKRWSRIYSHQLIREDIRDISGVKSIYEMETLFTLLPDKVGNPLSIPSLSRDLKVAYNTITSWLQLFERFFLLFTITPWTEKISRAIQKERKIYLWDVPRISDKALRFENMVALELFRAVTLWNDMGYGDFSLHFIRDKEKREVDFLIALERKPFLLIETKLTETSPSPVLIRYQDMLEIPAIQLVNAGESFQIIKNKKQTLMIAPAYMWIPFLP